MKYLSIASILQLTFCLHLFGQDNNLDEQARTEIHILIGQYSKARETQDPVLLKNILSGEVDQLVSSGEWRIGIDEAIAGMMRSSNANPGDRRLIVDKIKFLNSQTGIVDCRYEIINDDGSVRRMWSTFIVVSREDGWKIAGIRNMLPSGT
jgi:hypothetical protein